ncbi:MAG: hypothetical protein EBS48_02235 [Actinobacteria bacterium]|nr:hypothetical protein [Actinomycetota bacterium]NBU15827.1 hypothetical protein [Actinomycetota bacterium]
MVVGAEVATDDEGADVGEEVGTTVVLEGTELVVVVVVVVDVVVVVAAMIARPKAVVSRTVHDARALYAVTVRWTPSAMNLEPPFGEK